MDHLVEEFLRQRTALNTHGKVGRGRRYPEVMRNLAVQCAEQATADGQLLSTVAKRLGVPTVTLTRWYERRSRTDRGARKLEGSDGSGSRMCEVVIVEDKRLPADETVVLTLVTPDGYRIEGLSSALLATTLRTLRS